MSRLPLLVQLYIRQVIIGFGLSAGFVALLLALNVANLWHLVSNVSLGWVAVVMLWVCNGIVFSGVQFALSLPSQRNDGQGGGRARRPFMAPQPVLIPIRDEAPRHPHRRG